MTLLPDRLRIIFTQFRLLEQADGSILIAMKGIVLCVIEMKWEGVNLIYFCFNVTL